MEEKEEMDDQEEKQQLQSIWHIVNITQHRERHQPQFPVLNKNQISPLGEKAMFIANCGRYSLLIDIHCSRPSESNQSIPALPTMFSRLF